MKNAYIKFILAAVIFGTNGIIASHIPLSSYEIVLTRTVLGGFPAHPGDGPPRMGQPAPRVPHVPGLAGPVGPLPVRELALPLRSLPAYRRQPGNPHVLLRAHPDYDPVVLRLP